MRRLTDDERAVLRAVVLAGAPNDDALRAALLRQVGTARATGPSCTCGCASLGLTVDRACAPSVSIREFSADALDAVEPAGFRVLVRDGYMVDVEVYGYGDAVPSSWPPATAFG